MRGYAGLGGVCHAGGGERGWGHSLSLSHHIGERLDAQKERPGVATAGFDGWKEECHRVHNSGLLWYV